MENDKMSLQPQTTHQDTARIAILDFGSQVTQLIARRLREFGVYCEIFPYNNADTVLENFKPAGIILSGSPASVTDANAPSIPDWVFQSTLPVLGICYGQQALVSHTGGRVEKGDHQEFGSAEIEITESSALFKDLWTVGDKKTVWMSHGDKVTALPEDFKVIAHSKGAPFAAIEHTTRPYYGVQFHPEVVHTPQGEVLLKNFAYHICGLTGNWTMASFKDKALEKIREQVGNKRVICGLSGGVDSSVAAALLQEAIGAQLTCIFVDHGLLRAGEREQVEKMFKTHYGSISLVVREASDLFLSKLDGVSDPERKRKIIGETFIDVFEEEANKLGGADFLAQGTLYPDVIESISVVGDSSVTIKSHHNVGGLPERMNMDLVEPLRELFKDEVRLLGLELGLPAHMIGRHPFPGPGLAIRIPGAISKEKCDILRQADQIYLEEIRTAGLYDSIWQAFAVLLPIRTVGVMGDARTYDYVCGLRAVTSIDGMTADTYEFEISFLKKVTTRIINEVRGINRVVYDCTSKPPGTIEWE